MTAMFGGIVGQKVVQARSGKFHILFQCSSSICIHWNLFLYKPLGYRTWCPNFCIWKRDAGKVARSEIISCGAGALGCSWELPVEAREN